MFMIIFYWPVIWRGHQVSSTGRFRYDFKGRINYINADICRIKNMILLGRYNTYVYYVHSILWKHRQHFQKSEGFPKELDELAKYDISAG